MGTSPIVGKLRQLLTSENKDLVLSTIKVARALKLKDPGMVKILKKYIESNEHSDYQAIAIESIGELGGKDSVPILFNIFKTKPQFRLQAGRSLSQIGDSVIPQIKKEYKASKNDIHYKKALISILAKVKSLKANNALLDNLYETNLEVLKHICYEIRNPILALDVKSKTAIGKVITTQIRQAKTKKAINALVSLVIIMGYLADPKYKKVLMPFLDEKFPFVLRRNVLFSMARMGLKGKGHEDVVKTLIPFLDNHQFAGFYKTLSDILMDIDFTKVYQKKMIKLVESSSVDIKRLALSKIQGLESKETVTLLVNYLFDKNYEVRKSAEEALKSMPTCVPYLLNILTKKKDISELSSISNILSFHRKKVTTLRLKVVFDLMKEALKDWQEQKALSYFNILRQINPDYTFQVFLKESALLRKKKKYGEVIKLLELLSKSTAFNKDAKWELTMAYLLASSREVSVLSRNNDRSLHLIQGFIKSDPKDALKRLKKEKAIGLEHHYYVGFHFSEKLFDLKEFGVNVLKAMIKKSPSSKYSKMAKKRLQTVGDATKVSR